MKKIILLVVVWAGLLFSATAQKTATTLSGLTANFRETVSHFPHEKVFLDTDKNLYLTGETLWFKAYCVDAALHTASFLSSVLYIEILDHNGNALFQEKILLKNGQGSGQFFLPGEMISGNYNLRAYTAWMKNFSENFFYQQPLLIINPLKSNTENLLTGFPGSKSITEEAKNDTGKYVLADTRGLIQYSGSVSDKLSFPRSFPPGISHITWFDETFRPLGDKFIFTPASPETELKLSLPEKTFHNREKIQAEIQTTSQQPDSKPVSLSVSVYKYTPGTDLPTENIVDYLLFASDLTPSRRFNWEQVIKGTQPVTTWLPEIHSPLIQGNIRATGAVPVPDYFHLIFPGKSSMFYTATADDGKNFAVEISPEIQTTDLLFWADDVNMNLYDLEISPSFLPAKVSPKAEGVLAGENLRPLLESLSLNTQITNAYLPFTFVRGVENEKIYPQSAFYGSADISYNLDDYTRFPTMDEVFTEYIRYVIARKKKEDSESFYLWDLYANTLSISNSIFFEEPALTMIDGVPVGDLKTIWSFDPRKIKTIDMVNRKYNAGKKLFHGIIYFHTYKGDLAGEKIPADIVQKIYKPIQEPRSFFSPDYEKEEWKNSRIPDYRTLLYWNPEVYTDAQGKALFSFFTGDDIGHYRIEVNGISAEGTPLYGTFDFEVKGE
ncbi:MAG: hypothetical protein SF052_03725 [Bacteroidia bacterium]|nr:hypothetical protein [Bacteroidia bacterium]